MPNLALTTRPGKMSRRRRSAQKAYTLAQLETFVSSEHYDAHTAGAIASRVPLLPRAKEQLAPGISRIRGNLCNVHGKYGPCDKGMAAEGKKMPAEGASPDQSGTYSINKPKPKKAKRGAGGKGAGGKGKPKAGAKPAKPKATPEQRAQATAAKREQNTADVAKRMADSDAGLSPLGVTAMQGLSGGKQPDKAHGDGLVKMGMAEQAADGSYRVSSSGRAAMGAMASGDYQKAVDAISRAGEVQGKRGESDAKRQEAAGKRTAGQAARELAKRDREAAKKKRETEQAAKRKPVKAGAKPEDKKPDPAKAAPAKRKPASAGSSGGGGGGGASSGGGLDKPKPPVAPKPEKAPAKQIAPALTEAATALSEGGKVTEAQIDQLVTNGLVKRDRDGKPVLTPAGLRATMKDRTIARWNGRAWIKDGVVVAEPDQSQFAGHTMEDWDDGLPEKKPTREQIEAARTQFARALGVDTVARPSFRVFKDASGRYRWVAQSSSAFMDRDKEIVSTQAMTDDCMFADKLKSYGPLRWWHTPGLDLGDCDFNAMHGRILIESGTFRTPSIAHKVAQAAGDLEISLGFLHLPSEPDASGVFHHIRRFERSLVPRGKASNRFTAFSVKESPMFDPTKVAALKQLGFSDSDITSFQTQAEATEKVADAEQVAYKAEDAPLVMVAPGNVTFQPGERFNAANGDEYIKSPSELDPTGMYYATKAFGAPKIEPVEAAVEEVVEEDAAEPMVEAVEEDAAEGGLTLSSEDIAAIGQALAEALQTALGPLVSTMDLTGKIGSHMDELKGMMGSYTAKKDSSDAEKAEQITALKAQQDSIQLKLDELLGLQPEVSPRVSQAPTSILNPFNPADNALLAAFKNQIPADQQVHANEFEDLKLKLFGS